MCNVGLCSLLPWMCPAVKMCLRTLTVVYTSSLAWRWTSNGNPSIRAKKDKKKNSLGELSPNTVHTVLIWCERWWFVCIFYAFVVRQVIWDGPFLDVYSLARLLFAFGRSPVRIRFTFSYVSSFLMFCATHKVPIRCVRVSHERCWWITLHMCTFFGNEFKIHSGYAYYSGWVFHRHPLIIPLLMWLLLLLELVSVSFSPITCIRTHTHTTANWKWNDKTDNTSNGNEYFTRIKDFRLASPVPTQWNKHKRAMQRTKCKEHSYAYTQAQSHTKWTHDSHKNQKYSFFA